LGSWTWPHGRPTFLLYIPSISQNFSVFLFNFCFTSCFRNDFTNTFSARASLRLAAGILYFTFSAGNFLSAVLRSGMAGSRHACRMGERAFLGFFGPDERSCWRISALFALPYLCFYALAGGTLHHFRSVTDICHVGNFKGNCWWAQEQITLMLHGTLCDMRMQD
jgi:hypothetical protein